MLDKQLDLTSNSVVNVPGFYHETRLTMFLEYGTNEFRTWRQYGITIAST